MSMFSNLMIGQTRRKVSVVCQYLRGGFQIYCEEVWEGKKGETGPVVGLNAEKMYCVEIIAELLSQIGLTGYDQNFEVAGHV